MSQRVHPPRRMLSHCADDDFLELLKARTNSARITQQRRADQSGLESFTHLFRQPGRKAASATRNVPGGSFSTKSNAE